MRSIKHIEVISTLEALSRRYPDDDAATLTMRLARIYCPYVIRRKFRANGLFRNMRM